MNPWVIIVLYVVGCCLVVTELFVPGVVLGIVGLIALGAAVFLAYVQGYPVLGHSLVAVTLVSIPVFVWLWKSVIIRHFSLEGSEKAFTPISMGLEGLVGAEGVALTMLRPSGTALVEGKRVDVVSRGEMIEKGSPVRVIEVAGNRVVVKRV